eukprot:CAMPEP_0178694106 /NCGR_PEP_ID=MMETSP0699-20121125/8068_1 /TAXON_ID=265572 /ORGANISM="Extubocellulus spinifer, Strain CCMP396" /LENGTH=206 /DNA_ID=CAMNT_0020339561 /DNA_START=24 /DNA_END=641 /DNA_ORIENTATION=+
MCNRAPCRQHRRPASNDVLSPFLFPRPAQSPPPHPSSLISRDLVSSLVLIVLSAIDSPPSTARPTSKQRDHVSRIEDSRGRKRRICSQLEAAAAEVNAAAIVTCTANVLPSSPVLRMCAPPPCTGAVIRTQVRYHGGPSVSADAPTVKLTFLNPPSKSDADDGSKAERITVDARVGETLLQVAHRNHIDVEGACEGVCACSTCHVI